MAEAIDLSRWRGRINDADSHLQVSMRRYPELLGRSGELIYEWFNSFASGTELARILDPEDGEVDATDDTVWNVKGPTAPGAGSVDGRLKVLDRMGIARQLVFPQVMVCLPAWGKGEEALQVVRDYNDLCANWGRESGGRLRVVGLLNIRDLGNALAELQRALDAGVRAFLLPDGVPPGGVSPAAPEMDPLWSTLAAAGASALLHIGGHLEYRRHSAWDQTEILKAGGAGAGEIVNPHSLATVHQAPENFLAAITLGAVFERHPDLRFGSIEQGAGWVGPLAQRMDALFHTGVAGRSREVCSMLPSEYLRRNFRATPFVHEDVGGMIDHFGLEEVYCFSTDFPHPEGGRAPLQKMTSTLSGHDDEIMEKFLVGNSELLLGD
jgi:predicted TIM-barrel fold metal-dependent hydrolase